MTRSWTLGVATLQTAIDLLGWRPGPDYMGFNAQPWPYQFKGLGTNLAKFFKRKPFLDYARLTTLLPGELPAPGEEMRPINGFLVDVLNCVARGVSNPRNISVFGKGGKSLKWLRGRLLRFNIFGPQILL